MEASKEAYRQEALEKYNIDPYKLYTLEEVAGIFNYKVVTIRLWIYQHRLKGIQMPSHVWRIQGTELINILEGKRKLRKRNKEPKATID